MKSTDKQQVNFQLPKSIYKSLKAYCNKKEITLTSFLVDTIKNQIEIQRKKLKS